MGVSRPSPRTLLPLAVTTLALVAGLTACAEPTPTATDGGTVAPATALPTTTGPTTATGSSTAAPSTSSARPTTAAPAAFPTATVDVGRTIRDTGLGHRIAVTKILRGIPWPASYESSAQSYELVAVEMTWTPSTTYTAPLRAQDLSILTGSPFPSRPDGVSNAAMTAHQLALLPASVDSGSTKSGWLVFKVDPKAAPNLTLVYTRPKSETDTGTVFDTRKFSTVLVGTAVATG